MRPRIARCSGLAVVLMAEQQSAPSHLLRRETQLLGQASEIWRNGGRAGAGNHFVSDGAQRRAAPFDGDADLARVEQVVIVLGVADADRVVDRQPQRREHAREPDRLGDARRQHHETAAVERQDLRLLERANHVEHRGGAASVGLDDRIADRDVDAALEERIDESRARRVTDDRVAAALRKIEHGAVFGDDRVEAAEIARHRPSARRAAGPSRAQPRCHAGAAERWHRARPDRTRR